MEADENGTDRDEDAAEAVRCFRCGRLVPRDQTQRLHEDCPPVFRNRDLCAECVAVVRGKRGAPWWATQAG